MEELNSKIEKVSELTSLCFKVIENEIKMLRYEFQNPKTISINYTIPPTMNNIVNEITEKNLYLNQECRRCRETKQFFKHGKQFEKKICLECLNELIEEYESDEDIT